MMYAILFALPVKVFEGGWVESVFTRDTHFLADLFFPPRFSFIVARFVHRSKLYCS
jgi:hypothetical protein